MRLIRGPARAPEVSADLWSLTWIVLVVSALTSMGLGYWGFERHFHGLGESRSFLTLAYLSLQLFVLASGDVSGSVPWQLNVARFLAPLAAAGAAVAALLVIFREQVESLRIGRMRGHVIVCGLGEKGSLLVGSLRQRGQGVVSIERDASTDAIQAARAHGARVVVGDARSAEVLRTAGAQRAAHLIAVCGGDATNAEAAIQARTLAASRSRGALTCTAHIVDPRLCLLLRREELAGQATPGFRLDFFNVFESGARALLRDYPPFSEPLSTDRPHVAVVGLGHLGEAVVVRAARLWRGMSAAEARRLRITIVDEGAESKVRALALSHPDLASTCDFVSRQVHPVSPELEQADWLLAEDGSMVSIVYVCAEDEAPALSAALTLRRSDGLSGVPIVVAVARSGGVAGLLGQAGTMAALEDLHAFGLLDRTLTTDLLFGGTYEVLARAMHEEYVRQQAAEGQTPDTNKAMVAWDALPESLKESNRAQAAHIGLKLRAAGCALAPLRDDDAESFEFPPAEVERLAEIEHDRWVEERQRGGWSHAPGPKDIDRKTSPHMVPWSELSDEVKKRDRVFVCGLPKFLAGAGYQIVQVAGEQS